MSFDKAEITLRGRLGKDPDTFNGGCSASIGKNRKIGKQGTNNGEVTDWFTVKFFNRGNYFLGNWAAEQLRKGMRVMIAGDVVVESFTPQSSDKPVQKVVVYASEFDVISNRKQIEESVRAADYVSAGGQYGGHANPCSQHSYQGQAPQQNGFQSQAPDYRKMRP